MNINQLWYTVAKSRLRRPLNRVRHWGLDRHDVFIASYPRSGNTWLRFVLFDLLVRGVQSGFDELNHIIPDVGLHLRATPLLPGQGRLLKTHEPFHKEYRKAIYLVRDVRDVALSEYAYQKGIGWIKEEFGSFLPRFVAGTVNPFTPWHDHVLGWIDSPVASTPNLLILRFEQLRQDTEEVIRGVLDFLEVDVASDAVRIAIANNSLRRLQEKEAQQPQLSASAIHSTDLRFIRRGDIGNWRTQLTQPQLLLLDKSSRDVLQRLGYPVGKESQALLEESNAYN
ncbi:MAG: sulfotransferase domain-containing protein [Acidobacteriales bacterium]|nr:sulfotransferase domain-containing protein [Terriglobales bacterium]